ECVALETYGTKFLFQQLGLFHCSATNQSCVDCAHHLPCSERITTPDIQHAHRHHPFPFGKATRELEDPTFAFFYHCGHSSHYCYFRTDILDCKSGAEHREERRGYGGQIPWHSGCHHRMGEPAVRSDQRH